MARIAQDRKSSVPSSMSWANQRMITGLALTLPSQSTSHGILNTKPMAELVEPEASLFDLLMAVVSLSFQVVFPLKISALISLCYKHTNHGSSPAQWLT